VIELGAHTSIAGGFHRALMRGAEIGCEVIQIFCKSNQQWKSAPISDTELELWQRARSEVGVTPALVHASYLINLAAPAGDIALRSARGLSEELARTARLGIPYLVVHPGAHGGQGEAEGIARVASALDRALEAGGTDSPRILLENTAGQGSSLGYCFEHIRDIIGASHYPHRLGVCFDTCHASAAGYELQSDAGYRSTWRSFARRVGWEALCAFHLNDSRTPPGSRRDRHEHIGCGTLGLGAFHRLLNDPRFSGRPMVIETPKPVAGLDCANLALLRSLRHTARAGNRARRCLDELRELADRAARRA
jgi:deoxyribonuclease-4